MKKFHGLDKSRKRNKVILSIMVNGKEWMKLNERFLIISISILKTEICVSQLCIDKQGFCYLVQFISLKSNEKKVIECLRSIWLASMRSIRKFDMVKLLIKSKVNGLIFSNDYYLCSFQPLRFLWWFYILVDYHFDFHSLTLLHEKWYFYNYFVTTF